MNDTRPAPTFGQALAWAFGRLLEEMRTVLILSLLLVIVLLIAFMPLFGFYAELFGTVIEGNLDPDSMAAMEFPGIGFLFMMIVLFVGSSAVYVLIARLTDMDRSLLLEGGFGTLASRALWVIWRLICAIGWMMLVGLIMMVVMMVVMFGLGALAGFAMGEGATGVMIVVSVAFYVVMVVVFVGIYGALSVAIYAASRDIKIGVLASWNALKGCRRRLILANVILYLLMVAAYVLIALISVALFAAVGGLAFGFYLVLISLMAGIYAFLWLGVGAAFANHALART